MVLVDTICINWLATREIICSMWRLFLSPVYLQSAFISISVCKSTGNWETLLPPWVTKKTAAIQNIFNESLNFSSKIIQTQSLSPRTLAWQRMFFIEKPKITVPLYGQTKRNRWRLFTLLLQIKFLREKQPIIRARQKNELPFFGKLEQNRIFFERSNEK